MPLRIFLIKASWMLLIPIIESIYLLLNHATENVYILVTIVDERIPFVPYFIVPYIAWYGLLFCALAWFLYHDLRLYQSSLVTIIFSLLISFIVFSLYQTTVPRPEISSDDIFSQLTQLIYSIDNPYNAFPSIHVLTSYIIFLGCLKLKVHSPKISLALQAMIAQVILSTVFLKQHTLLDVLGGLILGGSLFKIINKYEGVFYRKSKETSKVLILKQNENDKNLDFSCSRSK
jgi:membrane-associated phospholipid phosphatase